ncbi:DUF3060 domain-containing protein [Mycolicibacterium sphagni]|nr:DUF3060 domain-containing protein [Mycolicibacterium sphagni]MCV7179602.1 DUF3060 domain-containing protein [Mycolicibacterium sphagni]
MLKPLVWYIGAGIEDDLGQARAASTSSAELGIPIATNVTGHVYRWPERNRLIHDQVEEQQPMKPEDDPEKRIQELERPLASQAQTSELGTAAPPGGWHPPPPPPPGYYGPPMPLPSVPSPYPGIRIGWIVLSLLIVGLFVGGGVVVWTNLSNRSAPGFPSIAGGGGTFSTATRPSRATPTPPGPSAGTVATAAPGGSVGVAGVNQIRTITCDDTVVTVSGMDNTVVATGHCTLVQVSGMNNVVTIDAADAIDASGMSNKITYRAGSPKITKSGFSNTVEQN